MQCCDGDGRCSLFVSCASAVLASLQGGGAPAATPATSAPTTTAAAVPPATSGDPLAPLRAHPQLNELKGLVQSNPAALPAVLSAIGRTSPGLLAVINSVCGCVCSCCYIVTQRRLCRICALLLQNRDAFIALMNEPIGTPYVVLTPSTFRCSACSLCSPVWLSGCLQCGCAGFLWWWQHCAHWFACWPCGHGRHGPACTGCYDWRDARRATRRLGCIHGRHA